MTASVSNWFDLADLVHTYKRQVPVVLVNGLAEQSESWFANRPALSRRFDVKVPEILVYDGDSLHERIDSGGEISVDYLAERLSVFLTQYVQRSPCYVVASSLGCQVALTVAVKRPEIISKLVLICSLWLSWRRKPADDRRGAQERIMVAWFVPFFTGAGLRAKSWLA